jgi:predicted phosphodiesterase
MRCAVIADIHANKHAVAAVADSIREHDVDLVLNAGDTFGYYPWAQEAFELLRTLPGHSVLGNHDALVRGAARPERPPSYWDAIEQNRQTLAPAARQWLWSLPCELRLDLDGRPVRMMHGTPDDPLEGRLYPDRQGPDPAWLPGQGEVLILGHTHYPVIEPTTGGGLLLNPGSVGQPRDGCPLPSWVLLETRELTATLFRVHYDRHAAMRELRAAGWDERSVQALDKTTSGPLVLQGIP